MSEMKRSACPDPVILLDFVSGELHQDQKATVLRHLAQCTNCGLEVARMRQRIENLPDDFFEELLKKGAEVVQRIENETSATLTPENLDESAAHAPAQKESRFLLESAARTLHFLSALVPQLMTKLSPPDFASYCQRLIGLSRDLLSQQSLEPVSLRIQETLNELTLREPRILAHCRGENETAETRMEASPEILRKWAEAIQKEIPCHLARSQATLRQEPASWQGKPELWVLDQLTPTRKERAVCIRDWCEEYFEEKINQSDPWYTGAWGVGHAKRVLGFAVEFLKVFQEYCLDPFNSFALYAAAYCHDLGVATIATEDPLEEPTFETFRCKHGQRSRQIILGNRERGIPPSWRPMGFANEHEAAVVADICAAHQKEEMQTLLGLPRSQSLLLDARTVIISPQVLATILRLANALDCRERRLPHRSLLAHLPKTDVALAPYIKHEIVSETKVDASGRIHILLRKRFHYPGGFDAIRAVQKELSQEIQFAREVLKNHGLTLPEEEYLASQALFLEENLMWND